MSAIIETNGLTRLFKQNRAVDGLDLEISLANYLVWLDLTVLGKPLPCVS